MNFKGGFGELLSQASRLKEDVQRIQESMALKTVEHSVGGGMVKVVANGKGQIVSITLDPEATKLCDPTLLQDLITAGVNEALKASQGLVSDEMGKLAGGLGPLAAFFKGF